MSQTGQTTFDEIASGVSTVVSILSPLAGIAFPEASVALSIGQKIMQGVIASEPEALSLFAQIKSGTPPTVQQLAQYQANYEAAYQQLNSDINAKLATAV